MKNTFGQSYDNITPIYVIVYGVKGHQNDVDSRIWNRIYKIKSIEDGNEDKDAANIKQLNEIETNLTNYLINQIDILKNQIKTILLFSFLINPASNQSMFFCEY